ncbi:MAG: cytochrome c biogenesis protein ResB [Desulfobacteraceae bacterium]|jgi:cytochrome c biogenesis protein
MVAHTDIKGNYIESFWKFFASVKLTVVVLLSLAALSIVGTLIPQNESPAEYFRAFGPFLYQVLFTLDIFDMYHSWWFQGLIIMLTANIVVCSIDRLQVTGKTIFARNPKFNIGSYRSRKSRKDFILNGNLDRLKDAFGGFMSKEFRYCKVVPADKGFAITAEKGRLTRLGVYIVHFSIVILLIGGLVSSLKGFEGFANIAEGETTDTVQLRFAEGTLKLPFTIQCDDFDVQFYDTGAPKEFRSKLTIIENGQPVLQKDIIVNDPLRYKGINIFQASYGEMNNPGATIDISKEIVLGFHSKASGMSYTIKAPFKQPVEIPEGLGRFVIEDYHPEAQFRGMAVGPALLGTLTPKEGAPLSILLPIKFPKFDSMRGGQLVISVLKAGRMVEKRYFTGLQITKDPGVGLVYAGFIMIIAGCMVTFFMSHQQVVLEVQPKGQEVSVMVSGKSNKNKVGFQYKLDRLADRLASLGARKNDTDN